MTDDDDDDVRAGALHRRRSILDADWAEDSEEPAPRRRVLDLDELYLRWSPPGDWVADAACRGQATWVVPARSRHHRNALRHPQVSAAIAACMRCPVLEQCTDWILAHADDPCTHHVVAGMTPEQRSKARGAA